MPSTTSFVPSPVFPISRANRSNPFRYISTQGFFYIVNFGFDQAEVDEQFAIGKEVFDLPLEERAKYSADHANGGKSFISILPIVLID